MAELFAEEGAFVVHTFISAVRKASPSIMRMLVSVSPAGWDVRQRTSVAGVQRCVSVSVGEECHVIDPDIDFKRGMK